MLFIRINEFGGSEGNPIKVMYIAVTLFDEFI